GYQLLALIFGTLLSSQGTDASFVLTLSGFPPGFRSSFPTLSESVPLAFRGLRFRAFPFRRFRLYQGFSGFLTTHPIYRKGIRGEEKIKIGTEEEESRPSAVREMFTRHVLAGVTTVQGGWCPSKSIQAYGLVHYVVAAARRGLWQGLHYVRTGTCHDIPFKKYVATAQAVTATR
ncbi:hypothetical protein, partial [Streptomyces sp. A1547]|uniref:hypothetical protein n=1 Tax=Streptomyces sp. A1547 TaxID=2563105 RepID=UPI00113A06F8